MLVDLGHHLPGANIEQIVAILGAEGRLGGFHFNNRKYADDDLIVGSVNPLELLLIFFELGGKLPRLTIDQAHNVEAKIEAMVLSVLNLQEAYAKARLRGLRGAGRGPVRGVDKGAGTSCCSMPTRPTSALRAAMRLSLGAAEDPIAEVRPYVIVVAERGSTVSVAGAGGR